MNTVQFGNVHFPVTESGWTAEKLERYLTRKKGVRALAVRKQLSNDKFVVTGKHKDAYESLEASRNTVNRMEGSLSTQIENAVEAGALTVRNEAQLKGLMGEIRNRLRSFQVELRQQELELFAQAKPYPNPNRVKK